MHSRKGALFIHRFIRKNVTTYEYLRNLIIYINNNSVHHNFSHSAIEWKYSSYKAIIDAKQTLINRNFVLELFGNIENFTFCINRGAKIEEEFSLE